MRDTASIVREVVEIAAPLEEVFEALTDPRELAAWLGDEAPDADSGWAVEPAPGTPWRSPAVAPDGTRGTVRGEYLVVARPHRIETTWRASWDDAADSLVRYELEPTHIDGAAGTRLTVTHTMASARAERAVRTHWRAPLGRLALLLHARVTA